MYVLGAYVTAQDTRTYSRSFHLEPEQTESNSGLK